MSYLTKGLIVALALAALAGGNEARANEKIVLAVNASSGGGDAAFIGSYKGYFADQGIDVQFLKVANPALGITAVVSGDADIGVFAPSAAFFNVAVNSDLKVLAGGTAVKPGYGAGADIVASNAAYDAGLKKASDLGGKRVGMTSLGGYTEYAIYLITQKYHIPFKSITMSAFSTDGNTAAAVAAGTIDAGVIANGVSAPMGKNGDGKIIASLANEVSAVSGTFITSHKALTTRRDALVKFMRGYVRAAEFYTDNFEKLDAQGAIVRTPEVDALLDRLSKDTGLTVAGTLSSAPYIPPDGDLDPAEIASYLTAWKTMGLVDANLDGSRLVDLSVLQEARKQ